MTNHDNKKPFWSVFLRDYYVSQDDSYVMFRELVISPFGNARDDQNEIAVSFKELEF